MVEHAILSASSAHRWLTCPPLPQLERFFENKTTEVAHEGTVAHSLAEYKVRKLIGEKTRKPKSKFIMIWNNILMIMLPILMKYFRLLR